MAKSNGKTGRVEIIVPRQGPKGDPNCSISVNGVTYLIPRGVKTEVPDFVAEEYERAQRAESTMYAEQQKMLDKTKNPISI